MYSIKAFDGLLFIRLETAVFKTNHFARTSVFILIEWKKTKVNVTKTQNRINSIQIEPNQEQ